MKRARTMSRDPAAIELAVRVYGEGGSLNAAEEASNVSREYIRRVLHDRGLMRGRLDYHGDPRTRILAGFSQEPNGCWLWKGQLNNMGYGMTSWRGHRMLAHRAVYMLLKSDIPNHLDACHHCDTPQCVNPDHIFVGTRTDNMRDAARKGRTRRGEQNPGAKLSEQTVRTILGLYSQGLSQREIGRRQSVDYRLVHSIVHRQSWKYVNV